MNDERFSLVCRSLVCATSLLVASGCGSSDGTKGSHIRTPIALQAGQIGMIVGAGGPENKGTDQVDANADGKVDPPIPVLEALLDTPMDVAFSPEGRLLVIDWNGHKIRAVDADGNLAFLVGTGKEGDGCEKPAVDGKCPIDGTELNHPTDMTFDSDGRLVIAAWHNSKLKRADLKAGLVENECGDGKRNFAGDGKTCKDANGLDQVTFDLPSSVVFDKAGNLLIADQANQVIRRIGAADGIVKTVAGNCPGSLGFGCTAGLGYSGDGGPATEAKLTNNLGQGTDPQGKIALDAQGNLYIADTGNNVIRKVTPGADGILGEGPPEEEIITTFAGTGEPGFSGDGGPATAAKLSSPTDVAAAEDGSVYIADRANSCVRKVAPDGTITTAAGSCGHAGMPEDGAMATETVLDSPYGVALDGKGGLYIAATHNNCICKVLLPK